MDARLPDASMNAFLSAHLSESLSQPGVTSGSLSRCLLTGNSYSDWYSKRGHLSLMSLPGSNAVGKLDFKVTDTIELRSRIAFLGSFTYKSNPTGKEVTSPFGLLARFEGDRLPISSFSRTAMAPQARSKPAAPHASTAIPRQKKLISNEKSKNDIVTGGTSGVGGVLQGSRPPARARKHQSFKTEGARSMSQNLDQEKQGRSEVPAEDLFLLRWSPRAFAETPIGEREKQRSGAQPYRTIWETYIA
jgi:hypothetical protein